MWTNFHTHSQYCDGKSSVTEHVTKASELGLLSLGFSSHAPLPFDRPWAMKRSDLERYRGEVLHAKSNTDVQVYAGLETDYIPGRISPSDFADDFDYTIGSIHFVEAFQDGDGWEIDGTTQQFEEGLNVIFKGDTRSAVTRYFELTRKMITEHPPTIVGHLDKIKIHNRNKIYFEEKEPWYVSQIEETLHAIKRAGVIAEVNTRGLYQRKTKTPYPSPWIIRRMSELQIPVTLSSDAHHADDLINQFESTAEVMYASGYRQLHVMIDNAWIPCKFNSYGIIR